MPAFLVELPDLTGLTLHGHHGANKMVVFAANATDAKAAAEAHFPGLAGWSALATATQVVAGTQLIDYEFRVRVAGAAGQSTEVNAVARGGAGNNAVASGVVNAGGTGYSTDDILTVVGGNFTRAATLRVTGQTAGVIDTVEVVDPGEYTVAPTLTANAVTGGGGSSATIDLTMAGEWSYEVFMGQLVSALNAHADIAGAAVDMSEGGAGARLLTVASGGGGDDLGDGTVVVNWGRNGTNVPGLSSTITDGGASTAALSVALPAVASLIIPSTPVPSAG